MKLSRTAEIEIDSGNLMKVAQVFILINFPEAFWLKFHSHKAFADLNLCFDRCGGKLKQFCVFTFQISPLFDNANINSTRLQIYGKIENLMSFSGWFCYHYSPRALDLVSSRCTMESYARSCATPESLTSFSLTAMQMLCSARSSSSSSNALTP